MNEQEFNDFYSNGYWKIWKKGMLRPVFVTGAKTAEEAYQMAHSVNEVLDDADSYEIKKLNYEEYKSRNA